jgi:hypothetical protein
MTAPSDIALRRNFAAGIGSVLRLVVHLFRCRHDWSITGCNGFGHPSEEVCIKCGKYRHRIHDFDQFRHGVDEE